MNDRELLECSAKAAGIEIDKSPCNGGGSNNDGFDLLGNAVLDWHNNTKWNPLADDGDALRLAVKLKIHISGFSGSVTTDTDDCSFCERYKEDECAATRRAIVRAAASMASKD